MNLIVFFRPYDIFSHQLLSAGCFLFYFTDHPSQGMSVRKIDNCLALKWPIKTKDQDIQSQGFGC